MDLAINGNFPELKGEFTVTHARAAVGVARRDAIGREYARGGDGGERSGRGCAGDVERKRGFEGVDGFGDSLLDEFIGFAEGQWRFARRTCRGRSGF